MAVIQRFWGVFESQPRWQTCLFAPLLASLASYFVCSILTCALTGDFWSRLALKPDHILDLMIYATPGILGLQWRLTPSYLILGVPASAFVIGWNCRFPTSLGTWVLLVLCVPGALAMTWLLLRPLPELLRTWDARRPKQPVIV